MFEKVNMGAINVWFSTIAIFCCVVGSSSSLEWCDFEDGFCNWKNSPEAGVDWIRTTGAETSNGPHADHTIANVMGHYLISRPTFAGQMNRAVLEHSLTDQTDSCLNLWVYGKGEHTLEIYVKELKTGYKSLLLSSTSKGEKWNLVKVNIKLPSNNENTITTEAEFHEKKPDVFIAIDDIFVQSGMCDGPPVTGNPHSAEKLQFELTADSTQRRSDVNQAKQGSVKTVLTREMPNAENADLSDEHSHRIKRFLHHLVAEVIDQPLKMTSYRNKKNKNKHSTKKPNDKELSKFCKDYEGVTVNWLPDNMKDEYYKKCTTHISHHTDPISETTISTLPELSTQDDSHITSHSTSLVTESNEKLTTASDNFNSLPSSDVPNKFCKSFEGVNPDWLPDNIKYEYYRKCTTKASHHTDPISETTITFHSTSLPTESNEKLTTASDDLGSLASSEDPNKLCKSFEGVDPDWLPSNLQELYYDCKNQVSHQISQTTTSTLPELTTHDDPIIIFRNTTDSNEKLTTASDNLGSLPSSTQYINVGTVREELTDGTTLNADETSVVSEQVTDRTTLNEGVPSEESEESFFVQLHFSFIFNHKKKNTKTKT